MDLQAELYWMNLNVLCDQIAQGHARPPIGDEFERLVQCAVVKDSQFLQSLVRMRVKMAILQSTTLN